MAEPLLEVKNLQVTYGSGRKAYPAVQTLPFSRRLKFFAAISAKPACLPDLIPCSTLILRISH